MLYMDPNKTGFESGQHLSLRDYVAIILVPMEREIINLRSAVEKLTMTQANIHEIDNLKFQVASLSEAMQELEPRLTVLENHDNILTWLFRVIAAVGTALLIAWLVSIIR